MKEERRAKQAFLQEEIERHRQGLEEEGDEEEARLLGQVLAAPDLQVAATTVSAPRAPLRPLHPAELHAALPPPVHSGQQSTSRQRPSVSRGVSRGDVCSMCGGSERRGGAEK